MPFREKKKKKKKTFNPFNHDPGKSKPSVTDRQIMLPFYTLASPAFLSLSF